MTVIIDAFNKVLHIQVKELFVYGMLFCFVHDLVKTLLDSLSQYSRDRERRRNADRKR